MNQIASFSRLITTPFGDLLATSSKYSLLGLSWHTLSNSTTEREAIFDDSEAILSETQLQLNQYFAGERKNFLIPIEMHATDFQRKVWNSLREVPYGQLRTYKQLAESIENPHAVRAVGQANKRNPVAILIPCHRIVASGNHIGGYLGNDEQGIQIKRKLIELEQTFNIN